MGRNHLNPEFVLRSSAVLLMAVILCVTCIGSYYGYVNKLGYNIGDWLINYQGGFIRRGFLGEIFLQVSRLTGTSPGTGVVLVQCFCYLCLYGFSMQLLWKSYNALLFLAAIFSPATFLFQWQDFNGGYRKEILFLALLAFLCGSSWHNSQKKFEHQFFIALLCYPFLILTHEMLALFLPYLLALYAVRKTVTPAEYLKIAVYLLPSLVAFLCCVKYSGNRAQVVAILASLGDYAPAKGAIDDLPARAINVSGRILESLKTGDMKYYYLQALVFASLAFLPLASTFRWLLSHRQVLFSGIGAWLCTIPLFAVATDWGRFIYIHMTAVLLLCLLIDHHRGQKNKCVILLENRKYFVALPFIGLALYGYATLWDMEHCCI